MKHAAVFAAALLALTPTQVNAEQPTLAQLKTLFDSEGGCGEGANSNTVSLCGVGTSWNADTSSCDSNAVLTITAENYNSYINNNGILSLPIVVKKSNDFESWDPFADVTAEQSVETKENMFDIQDKYYVGIGIVCPLGQSFDSDTQECVTSTTNN
mgnify:CR=1 FL=1